MSSECLTLPAVQPFLEFALNLLYWLARLATFALTVVILWMTLRQVMRLITGSGAFLDGAIDSPDLALEFIGRHQDAPARLAEIVRHSGHLLLLRNLVLDSRGFVPVYTISFIVAIVCTIGLPFTCGRCTISLPAIAAILLTVAAAVLDWLENAAIAKAIRLNGQSDNDRKQSEAVIASCLAQANWRASAKFCLLGVVLLMLGWYASPSILIFGWPAPIPRLFFAAGLLLLIGTVRLRLLETGIATAGLGIITLFLALAWR